MNHTARIIGLTGGIGAGKSAASARFSALGAVHIDADALARAALDIDGICYADVVRHFGGDILLPGGAIDRRELAKVVFSDEEERKVLNDIVHPRVIDHMLAQAKRIVAVERTTVVILDVPLLFECGMETNVDRTVLVYTDDALRIERILRRDNCTGEEAAARIRAQMPQEEKCVLADYILNNSGPVESLMGQVDALYQIFRSRQF